MVLRRSSCSKLDMAPSSRNLTVKRVRAQDEHPERDMDPERAADGSPQPVPREVQMLWCIARVWE